MSLSSIIHSLSSLVTDFVPSPDAGIRLRTGMLAGEIASFVTTSASGFSWSRFIPSYFRNNCVHVSSTVGREDSKRLNPLFEQLQEYLISKYYNEMYDAKLVPKKGDLVLEPQNGCRVVDEYLGQKVTISIVDTSTQMSNQTIIISKCEIIVWSKTLSLTQLKDYIQTICKFDRILHSTIVVYRPLIQTGKRDEVTYAEWDRIEMKTNKTLENTIYSHEVQKSLFEDLDWFMNNEHWYTSRGIPYKRGYLCHGLPGTGKTSIAKIIANKYRLPIFVIDMQTIQNNSDFTKLVTEINYLADKRYIVSIEDFDRCDMMRDKYYVQNNFNKKISVQCFLNFLDGVVETHGRICIMSANEISVMQDNPVYSAMVRPGRIDVKVEFKACDVTQLSKLFTLFYNLPLETKNINNETKLTPAQVINVLSRCSADDARKFLESGQFGENDVTFDGNAEGNSKKSKVRCVKKCTCAKCRNKKTLFGKMQQTERDLKRIEGSISKSFARVEAIRSKLVDKANEITTRKQKLSEKQTKISQRPSKRVRSK